MHVTVRYDQNCDKLHNIRMTALLIGKIIKMHKIFSKVVKSPANTALTSC